MPDPSGKGRQIDRLDNEAGALDAAACPACSAAPSQAFHKILHGEGADVRVGGWFRTDLASLPVQEQAEIERGAAANTVIWVKPLGVTFGLGFAGLVMFVGSFFMPQLAEQLGWGKPGWLPWTRALTMLLGAIVITVAAPAPVTQDRVPADPNAPPLPSGPRPLKTRR